jgi:hypothetical protein
MIVRRYFWSREFLSVDFNCYRAFYINLLVQHVEVIAGLADQCRQLAAEDVSWLKNQSEAVNDKYFKCGTVLGMLKFVSLFPCFSTQFARLNQPLTAEAGYQFSWVVIFVGVYGILLCSFAVHWLAGYNPLSFTFIM